MNATRRTVLALPLALSGCGLWDNWFGEVKTPIPGKREPVLGTTNPLSRETGAPPVVLPPPVRNAAWPQPGGNPAHLMGNLEARPALAQVWDSSIGDGGGYRKKVLAQPVAANGLAYTMDSAARLACFGLNDGQQRWRIPTRGEDSRSTNLGGGISLAGDRLYATNGLGDVIGFDPVHGTSAWRVNIGAPVRGGPTFVEGRLFVTTIEDKIVALDASTGRQLWQYTAANAQTALLGEPAPAYADGIVVAGFASGELAALRADSGTVVWTDNLVAPFLGGGLQDINSIRGYPAIGGSQVFAVSMGGLVVSNDLHSGRRLWQHSVSGEDSPCLAGDWLFVVTLNQILVALHASDGTVGWTRPLPRWKNEEKQRNPITWFGPLLAGDRLIITGTNDRALAVSPYTGQILGQQKLSGAAAPVQPSLVEGTLLLIAEDGRLLALR